MVCTHSGKFCKILPANTYSHVYATNRIQYTPCIPPELALNHFCVHRDRFKISAQSHPKKCYEQPESGSILHSKKLSISSYWILYWVQMFRCIHVIVTWCKRHYWMRFFLHTICYSYCSLSFIKWKRIWILTFQRVDLIFPCRFSTH